MLRATLVLVVEAVRVRLVSREALLIRGKPVVVMGQPLPFQEFLHITQVVVVAFNLLTVNARGDWVVAGIQGHLTQ